MYKSYYYLNRLIIELRPLLNGKKILNMYSQEKDHLIIHLFRNEDLFLDISVNHSQPFINVKNKFSRARKNTITFFDDLIGAIIKEVLIASDDRIIKLLTDRGDLFFAIRGKYTNLFLDSDNLFNSFKSEDATILSDILVEFKEKKFINYFNVPNQTVIIGKDITEIRKNLRYIGREIENEIKARKNGSVSDSELLFDVLTDIQTGKPTVFLNENFNVIQIGFSSLLIYSEFKKDVFDDLHSAFNYFLIKKYQTEEKFNKLKKINSFIDKELKKLSSRLNNLLTVIEKGSQEEQFNKIANLLLINLNSIKPGGSEIEVYDIYNISNSEKKIIINLESKLSPQKNADRYFEKARDSKINFVKSKIMYDEGKKEFEKLKTIKQLLISDHSIVEINNIMKELKIKDNVSSISDNDLSVKFKNYLIAKKYHIYVGKDSKNNDLLTTKFAKQNDFWFHARSVSGSHVVLRVENTKEIIAKYILKKTASIAAYHSKAKTAGIVPVSYTLKKYVVKRKGMPTGQVSLLKEEVLLVKAEIPDDCEFLIE